MFRLKNFINRSALLLGIPVIAITMFSSLLVLNHSHVAYADDTDATHIGDPCTPTSHAFFGLPPWWQYVPNGTQDGLGGCDPNIDFPSGLFAVGLAVLSILLHIAGFAAVIFIMIAGVVYITSSGNPERAKAARMRIINALAGMAIVLIASALVAYIGDRL